MGVSLSFLGEGWASAPDCCPATLCGLPSKGSCCCPEPQASPVMPPGTCFSCGNTRCNRPQVPGVLGHAWSVISMHPPGLWELSSGLLSSCQREPEHHDHVWQDLSWSHMPLSPASASLTGQTSLPNVPPLVFLGWGRGSQCKDALQVPSDYAETG